MTTSTPNLTQLKIPSLLNKNKYTKGYKYELGQPITKGNQTSKITRQFSQYINHSHIHKDLSQDKSYFYAQILK